MSIISNSLVQTFLGNRSQRSLQQCVCCGSAGCAANSKLTRGPTAFYRAGTFHICKLGFMCGLKANVTQSITPTYIFKSKESLNDLDKLPPTSLPQIFFKCKVWQLVNWASGVAWYCFHPKFSLSVNLQIWKLTKIMQYSYVLILLVNFWTSILIPALSYKLISNAEMQHSLKL